MKQLVWRDEFAIDHSVIDADHKYLINLYAQFQENPDQYDTVVAVINFLKILLSYCDLHFAREEKLQRAARFPFRDDHKALHASLRSEVQRVIQKAPKVFDGDPTQVNAKIAKLRREVQTFMFDWLMQHILEEDLMMRAYVDRMREAAGGMSPIEEDDSLKHTHSALD